jgi:hydrogenase expression/formation protein HypC
VIRIDPDSEPLMGTVNFGGITKQICLAWVPEVTVGEYVVVHVGFAISRLDEAEAMETLKMIEAMGGGPDDDGGGTDAVP